MLSLIHIYVMEIKLENESLELTINSFGAELKSITGKETGTQYLWDADEKYWKLSLIHISPSMPLKSLESFSISRSFLHDIFIPIL